MNPASTIELTPETAGQHLRDALIRDARLSDAVSAGLRYRLEEESAALLSEETVARVRAMVRDVARQLLEAQAVAAGAADAPGFVARHLPALAARLVAQAPFLDHVHALVVEGEGLERLSVSAGLDPVLTETTERAAASDDGEIARLGMAVVAAQARFVQQHARMELPLRDVPAELFHAIVGCLDRDNETAADAAQQMRSSYDEASARPALLAHFALAIERDGQNLLEIKHSGLSVFSAALAMAIGEPRERVLQAVALSPTRLAVSLVAAGRSADEVASALAILGHDDTSAVGADLLSQEMAASALRDASRGGMP